MNEMRERSNEITIRPGLEGDLPGIVACLAAAFEPYRGSYTEGGFRDTVPSIQSAAERYKKMSFLVAELEPAQIIGTIAYQALGSGEGHLRSMAVVPEYQGRGVASRLLGAAQERLRVAGCSRVTLDTTRPLIKAVKFYERHGYRASGTVGDFFGMPLFQYAKYLDPGAL